MSRILLFLALPLVLAGTTAASSQTSPAAVEPAKSPSPAVAAAPPLATATDASSLAATAASIDAPRVGPAVRLAGPLRIGRATIGAAGTRAWRLLAGDEACGLLLESATLRYVVDDPLTVPVARRNLDRASRLPVRELEGGLVIEEPVAAAVVWGWELAPDAQPEAGAAAPAGADGGLPSWAREVLARPLFRGPAADLLEARALGVGDRVWAVLRGSPATLRLRHDPLGAFEDLARLEALDSNAGRFRGRWQALELATQPLGRAWWEPVVPPSVTTHTALTIDNPAGTALAVGTRSRVRALRDGLGLWRVSLVSEVPGTERKELVEVLDVSVDGRAAQWLHRDGELLVRLAPALRRDAEAEVIVRHRGALAQRPGNDSYWVLGTWPWYPQPSLASEHARFEIEVAVAAPFVAFASGDDVERETRDGRNVLRTRLDQPMQFPVVAAGKYHFLAEEQAGRKATVAAYVFGQEEASRRLMQNYFSVADAFSRLFNTPHPFGEVDIVEIHQWGWGQAPPGVIFITQEAYNPLGGELNQLFSQGINGRYVHEIAHAWWGHALKMGNPEEQWLTESLAEYSAALALQGILGGKKGQRHFDAALRAWAAQAKQIGNGGSIYLANHLAGDDDMDFVHRIYLLYGKGPYVIHALRQELGRKLGEEQGERVFFSLWRSLLKNFPYRFGETRAVVGILNQITGENWQPWFERYVYGTELPPVTM